MMEVSSLAPRPMKHPDCTGHPEKSAGHWSMAEGKKQGSAALRADPQTTDGVEERAALGSPKLATARAFRSIPQFPSFDAHTGAVLNGNMFHDASSMTRSVPRPPDHLAVKHCNCNCARQCPAKGPRLCDRLSTRWPTVASPQGWAQITPTRALHSTAWTAVAPKDLPMAPSPMLALASPTTKSRGRGPSCEGLQNVRGAVCLDFVPAG